MSSKFMCVINRGMKLPQRDRCHSFILHLLEEILNKVFRLNKMTSYLQHCPYTLLIQVFLFVASSLPHFRYIKNVPNNVDNIPVSQFKSYDWLFMYRLPYILCLLSLLRALILMTEFWTCTHQNVWQICLVFVINNFTWQFWEIQMLLLL